MTETALKPLVLATRNEGKVKELAGPLAACGFAVQLPPEDMPEVVESGKTFRENALLKARTYAAATGLPALADDSGLIVDDLCGTPGVFSARYGNDIPLLEGESNDQRNIRKVLQKMALLRQPLQYKGEARFHCSMAVAWPHAEKPDIVTKGIWEGHIVMEARGSNGFGYDPIFEDAASGKTAAEMTLEEKNAISHRAKALAALLDELKAQA